MGNSINRQRTGGFAAARYLYDDAGGYFDGRGRACYYMPDYQGNNLGVVDADGHLAQRTDYYPYGEAWRQPEADINPWLYSDKELLSVDGQHEYDFGARRYTPGFPMFTTPDPLSEVRPWHSPYLFCGANPVMNTDPTGMNYYAVDRKGYFYLLERNEDSYDRIFSYNNTVDYSNYIEVSKDFISSMMTDKGKPKSSTDVNQRILQDTFTVNYDTDEIFAFLYKNTDVEWGQVKMIDQSGNRIEIIGTCHCNDQDGTAGLVYEKYNGLDIQFIECNHNHTSPVYKPSDADVEIAKDYTSRSGECTFTIYSKYSPFVEYNKDSPTGPIDLPEYEFIYTPNKN